MLNDAVAESDRQADTLALAERHGLHLAGDISFNETGLDFRVGFATDMAGRAGS